MGHHHSILLLAWMAGIAALALPSAQAYQEIPIAFEYPSFTGDFYVSGTVALPPGALRDADNLAVYSAAPDKEAQSKIVITGRWPDGSILKARVLFPANIQRRTTYQVRYGDEIRHRNSFEEAAILPTVSFSVGGAARIPENMDVSVGQINVRVDRSPQVYYYWHLIPITLLIVLIWFRARLTRRVSAQDPALRTSCKTDPQLRAPPWWRRIFTWRRLVQILALILLVYGGYFFKKELFTTGQGAGTALIPALKPPEGAISTTAFQPGNILWPSGATPVLELYPPGLICRFNPQGGMFKACPLHLLSENLTWQTPIRFVLPHITLFLLLCFLFGRMWCGWACPIGTVGDVLTWIRRRMHVGLRRFSARWRHALRTGSYALLGGTLAISTAIGLPNLARFQCFWFLPYCQICPARLLCPMFGLINPVWKDFSNLVTIGFTLLAWLFMGLFVAAFYFGRRVWCHLCPVGLLNSWFNRGAAVELRKKALRCNKCTACAEACPMGLTKMYRLDKDQIYNEQGCIMCFRCVEACPQNDCLSAGFLGKQLVASRFKAEPVPAPHEPELNPNVS